jgi:sugar-specific transcriptional regulator TrmB
VLEALVARDFVSPGDVVVETGLPRYMVLAYMQCLEALGVVEPVYVKGSHKLYTVTPLAEKLLKALKEGARRPIEAILAGIEAPSSQPSNASSAQVEA